MSPLITVREHSIGGVLQPTVDGRELWEFFEARTKFTCWMDVKCAQHALVENVDYVRRRTRREEVEPWQWRRVSKQIKFVLTVSAAERIGAKEVCRGPVPWV